MCVGIVSAGEAWRKSDWLASALTLTSLDDFKPAPGERVRASARRPGGTQSAVVHGPELGALRGYPYQFTINGSAL